MADTLESVGRKVAQMYGVAMAPSVFTEASYVEWLRLLHHAANKYWDPDTNRVIMNAHVRMMCLANHRDAALRHVISLEADVERLIAEAGVLRKALDWYSERAASAARYTEQGLIVALTSLVTELALDAGKRARAALGSCAGEKAAEVLALAPLIDQLLSFPSDGTPEMDAKSAELAERWHAAVAAMEADRG